MNYEIKIGNNLEILKTMDDESVNCVVTSPPYWGLRDYGIDGQYGLEETPEEFIENLVELFREIRRVLRDDGTVWLNLGDTYMGGGNNRGSDSTISDKQKTNKGAVGQCKKPKHPTIKPKNLIGIPWKVAFALQDDGWILRQDIIWHKPNPMPESVKDRCTKSHEYIFLLTKNKKYYYDNEAILEPISEVSIKRAEYGWDCDRPSTKNASMGGDGIHVEKMGTRFVNPKGKNKRSVWSVTTKPFKGAHFAVYPPQLIEPCILAGCPDGGVVLDPFSGSGTTGVVALNNNKNYIGIELNPEYATISHERIKDEVPNTLTEFME
jgi:DNA modification methylase